MTATDTPPTDDELSEDNTLRRRIVQTFGGLGIVSFAGAMLTPLKSLGIEAQGGKVDVKGQNLVLAEKYKPKGGDTTYDVGKTVTKDMMTAPDSILTYPENLQNKNHYMIRLHRLNPDDLAAPTNIDWSSEGYVAYSAICTHLGCTVDWDTSKNPKTGKPFDHCYCHGSEYDPYKGAEVIRPPAPRALPQIGLQIADNGNVQLTSDFEGKVGP